MTPTKDQLDRYMDLVVSGEDSEDAIAVIWAEQPPEAAKPPVVMVTEFPDGVIIGWDHCAIGNSGCGKHISKCKCKGGPRELKVFAKWRGSPGEMPAYGSSSSPQSATLVFTESTDGPPALPAGSAADMPGRPSADDLPTGPAVPCVLGEHLADLSYVDKNDDGTYSCFACQEKGLQRGPQVDG